eukprot:GHVU01042179.1.p1 GENE.GHVU01042179.1~~GHVU01042179.1.p1  ORF type:complete len:233 (+),score=68.75 GHVU01042179.1:101-700(+)
MAPTAFNANGRPQAAAAAQQQQQQLPLGGAVNTSSGGPPDIRQMGSIASSIGLEDLDGTRRRRPFRWLTRTHFIALLALAGLCLAVVAGATRAMKTVRNYEKEDKDRGSYHSYHSSRSSPVEGFQFAIGGRSSTPVPAVVNPYLHSPRFSDHPAGGPLVYTGDDAQNVAIGGLHMSEARKTLSPSRRGGKSSNLPLHFD